MVKQWKQTDGHVLNVDLQKKVKEDHRLRTIHLVEVLLIINADGKAVEWVVGSWLANDPVALKEIIDGLDMHTDNQARFGLPSRLIAKKFIFRLKF